MSFGEAKIEGQDGPVDAGTPSPVQPLEEASPLAKAHRTTGKSPAFQYYPKDFLTDSNVLAMSLTEIGAYWKLISICWIDDTLPTSTAALARLVGVPLKHFTRLWPALAPCFKEKNGRLIHPRLERERAGQAAYRAKQSDNGKKGGRPTTQKNPSLSTNKAVGSSGLSQSEAKESSSSPISDLQSSSAEERRIARAAPLHDTSHKGHAHCGRVCLPAGKFSEFVRRRGGSDADGVIRSWAMDVEREWGPGGPKFPLEPGPIFPFWEARYSERWPPSESSGSDPNNKLPPWAQRALAKKAGQP